MKKSYKIFGFCLLCSFVLLLTTGEAYADNVLDAVRTKALNFLKSLRPVIFILAGFGLVGFAWMAIFNKISWKWFANIAMGLFLVANMGLVVDYFSGNDGHRRDLGYGNYLNQPDYIAMSGVASDPKEQKAQNDGTVTGKEGGGDTPNSDSNQLSGDNSGLNMNFAGGMGGAGTGGALGGNSFGFGSGGTGGSSGGNSFLSPEAQAGMDDINRKVRSLASTPADCVKAGGNWNFTINRCI